MTHLSYVSALTTSLKGIALARPVFSCRRRKSSTAATGKTKNYFSHVDLLSLHNVPLL